MDFRISQYYYRLAPSLLETPSSLTHYPFPVHTLEQARSVFNLFIASLSFVALCSAG